MQSIITRKEYLRMLDRIYKNNSNIKDIFPSIQFAKHATTEGTYLNQINNFVDRLNPDANTDYLLYDVLRTYLNEERNTLNTLNKEIIHTVKKNGQYGYYCTNDINLLADLIKHLPGINSICDFGCGTGKFIKTVQLWYKYCLNRNIDIAGVEYEPSLVEFAINNKNLTKRQIINADFFTLSKKYIQKFDAIYMYEPVNDKELAKKLAKLLWDNLLSTQYIILNPAGYIMDYLASVGFLKSRLSGSSGYIYIKPKIN